LTQDLRRGFLLGVDGTGAAARPGAEAIALPLASATGAPVKVGMLSLGCPKNLVDGEVMLGQLRARGHELVADAREADVVVVNTCAFIDRAKQESVDAILEMAALKEQGKAKRLVVTGCLSQRYDAELRREIPEIDASLGTGQVADIVGAVEGRDTSLGEAPALPTWVYDHTSPRLLTTPSYMAYVKISEGCDYTCSFCIIPTLRGKHRSRSPEDVVAEVRSLAERGVKEVVLVAQDSTRYGLDLGVRDGLAYLLRRLGRIDGLRWIRVMYAYPATLTDPILDAMASEDKVVKYVDIPLQHASESVLKRMKRPTGRGNLLGMVERIREKVPGVAVRTSFIVGFPGETEADFAELLAFVEAGRFDNVGVFTFSDEEGTSSFDLEGRIAEGVKKRRRDKLMSLQRRLVKKRNRARVGERVEVLVEGLHEDTDLLLVGRTAAQAPDIDGRVILNDGTAASGDLVRAEITEAHDYDFVARIVA